jgi:dienelactone hydrolase
MTAEDFLAGKPGTPITLAGQLRLPKLGEKLPAVILLHDAGGVGGTRNAYDFWLPALNGAGFATFAVDSFSGRGVFNYPAEAGKVPYATRTLDAFGALAAISKHPTIDPDRIAIMGFSHGSVAAMLSNVARFQKMHGANASFAAHISVYGICGTTYKGDDEITKPLLMLHGEADDWVPAAPCQDYEQRLSKAGKTIKLITYPGAHHAYDVPLYQERKLPNSNSFSKCRLTEAENGQIISVTSKQPFTSSDPCLEKGVTIGYHEAAAKKSQEDVVAFLRGIFKMK